MTDTPAAPTADTPPVPRRRLVRDLFHWCLDHEFLCALYVLAIMLGLAALSAPIGIHSVQFDGWIEWTAPQSVPTDAADKAAAQSETVLQIFKERVPYRTGQGEGETRVTKEVGYLTALNWGLYSVLVVPVMAFCILRLWRSMPEALRQAATRGLIRDSDLKLLSSEAVEARWTRLRRTCGGLFLILVLFVVAFIGWDWWAVVGQPLVDPAILSGRTLQDPSLEFDWSIACLYPSGPDGCGGVFAFGLIAYILIAIGSVAIAFASCVVAALFVAYLCGGLGRRDQRFTHLAIPCSSTDDRGGFEIFGSFFSALFGLCIAVVIGCLLMIIQNAYLRDPNYGDVFNFIFDDLGKLVEGAKNARLQSALEFEWVNWLFEPADRVLGNQQTGIGLLLLAITVLLSTGLSWWLLRQTARSARRRSWDNAAALSAECGMAEDRFRDQLRRMDFWPVGWMKQNQLFILLLSLLASVFSYRLMLLPIAWVAVQGGKAIWDLFRNRAKRSDYDLPPS